MKKVYLAFFFLALGLRLLVSLRIPVIAKDSVVYLESARNFIEGNYQGWLSGWEPLYPLLAALTGGIIANLEWGGRIVSALFGALTIFPLFFLAKRIFGERVGYFTTLFYLFHPVLLSLGGQALTDSTYIFFLVSGAAQGVEALFRGSRMRFFLAGVFIGAAYLVRPEGSGLIIIIVLWSLVLWRFRPPRAVLLWGQRVLALGVGFLVLALPYLVYLRYDTGYFTLTRRYAVSSLVGGKGDHPATTSNPGLLVTAPSRMIPAAGFISRSFAEQYHFLLLALAIFGLSRRRGRPYDAKGETFLLSVVASYLGINYLFYLIEGRGFIQERYLSHQISIALPWAGAGFAHLWEGIRGRFLEARARVIGTILLVFILVVLGAQGLRGRRHDKLYLMELGNWIKQEEVLKPVVMSFDPRIPYYAGGVGIPLLRDRPEVIMEKAIKSQARYVVVQEEDREFLGYDLLPFLQGSQFRLVHTGRDHKGRWIMIFRWQEKDEPHH